MGSTRSNPANGRWILAATTLASSTAFLLGAAVNIALPSIQTYFASNIAGIEWVVNSQLLFLSTLLLIGGSLGDHFGRKRIFVIGIAFFTSASVLAGFAPSIGWLILFQAFQGIGSALMVPQSLAIINSSFAENQRGRVIGLWAGISGAIAALGPWLGGWLVQVFSWRAVYFINVPISLLALIIAWRYIPESQRSADRKLDWSGTLLAFLALLGIAYGLISGPVSGWNRPDVLTGLIGGAAATLAFARRQTNKKDSLIPVQIFSNPLVAGANAATVLLYFALNGILFFLTLNLQQIQKLSPSEAGLVLLTPTILIAIFSGPAGSLADKIGPRLQMIVGPGLVGTGAALLAILGTDRGYLIHFFPGLSLVGCGMALVIAPLTKSALMVEPRFSGSASGINNAVARFAALMAIAILGAIVIFSFGAHLQASISTSDLSQTQSEQLLVQSDRLGGIVVPDSFDERTKAVAEEVVRESFIFSFRCAMSICSIMALCAAVVSSVMIHNVGG
jgi:EmrB/QacA subfamily drug resistance transporter